MTNSGVITKWFADNGDYTHNITYNLTDKSVIMDLGGYTGVWAQQMIDKYNPNVYIIEPVTKFYEGMVNKFSNNSKVHLMNVGVSTEDKDGFIYISGDATSSNLVKGESISVKFNSIDTILKKWGKFGMICTNAFESQALLYLYKNYCIQKRCLECQFGNNMIIDGS